MKDTQLKTEDTDKKYWQTVYLACRSLFSGPHANIRRSRTVTKRLTSTQATSHPLLRSIDVADLTRAARSLLRQGVFADEAAAKNIFPDMFEAVASAAVATTLAGNDKGTPLSDTTDLKATARQVIKVSVNSTRYRSHEMSLAKKYPTLAMGKLPYQAQHAVLSQTQQLLEECFYDLAKTHFPDLMKARNWDSTACVELSECSKLLLKPGQERSRLLHSDLEADGQQLDEVLHAMIAIRNSTAHRRLHTADQLSRLLKKALQFTEMAGDPVRAERLARVGAVVEESVAQMRAREGELDAWMSRAMREIREKRKLLAAREADLWQQLQRRHEKSRRQAQTCLNAAVLAIFKKPLKVTEPAGKKL